MFGLTPYERGSLWPPFRDIEKEFFNNFRENTQIRTDIKDEGSQYILECEMPGFDKDDIKIDINGNTLVLCAEKKSENSKKNEKGEYIRRREAMVHIAAALISAM